MMNSTVELLKALTAPEAVSGCEDSLTSLLTDILSDLGDVTVDKMSNVFCTFGSGRHFLLDAHIDEIGLVVTDVTDSGYLKLSPVGGVDRRFLPASEVVVLSDKRLHGVVCAMPPHLRSDKDKKTADFSQLAIDIGMSAQEARAAVKPGDRAAFVHRFDILPGGLVSSNCLDNRSGAAAVILALKKLKGVPAKITAMFSSQEEVGLRGAQAGAFASDAEEAISVDVSFGWSPQCSKDDCGNLSGGAMIGYSPVLSRDMSAALADCAKRNSIPYQKEVMSGRTSTTADVIGVSHGGVKTGLISVPLRYMHTPSEVIDPADVESAASLIAAYITERSGGFNA